MDSFELNKIMGAVLGTLLFVMGTGFVAEAIYAPHEDVGPGYTLPEPEAAAGEGTEVAVVEDIPLATLFATASVDKGVASAKKCQSCHTFNEGGANKTGPNLWDVIDRHAGTHEGFAYSDIFKQFATEGKVWDFDSLDDYLTAPRTYAPGTKMTFAGIKSHQERADLLAYLQTLSAAPKPFPQPEPAAEAATTTEATTVPADSAPVAAPAPTEGAPVTQSETPVQGTGTRSGEVPEAGAATPAPAAAEPAPTAPAAPAQAVPVATPAPAAPATP